MNNEKQKLKPCPACGTRGKHLHRAPAGGIYCPICGVRGPYDDPSGEKWNALPRRERRGPIMAPLKLLVGLFGFVAAVAGALHDVLEERISRP